MEFKLQHAMYSFSKKNGIVKVCKTLICLLCKKSEYLKYLVYDFANILLNFLWGHYYQSAYLQSDS